MIENYKVKVQFNLDRETQAKLKELAERDERSASAMLRIIINQYYDKQKEPKP